jgi:type II secretory pathway pseudopilin PulG
MGKISIYLIGILSLAVVTLYWQLDKTITEKQRLSNNQEALLSDVDYYKTESGKNAASVQKLELTKSELEKYNVDLKETISDLNLKINRIQAAATTATQSNYKIKIVVKDSIAYRDVPVKLQRIDFRDPYIDLTGTIDSGTFSGDITTRDTLVQIIHRVPKKFLFIKYGTKAIRQEVVSKNPYSKIVYTEYIELKK